MQKFKLPSVRVLELSSVVDGLQAKDLATLKDIRLNVSIVNDLNSFIKDLSNAYSDLNAAQVDALKPFQEKFKEQSVGLNEEEKSKLADVLNKEFKDANDSKFVEMGKKIEELGKVEIEVELGDEKMSKLKEWVGKFGPEKYLDKKVFVNVCDALGIE